MDEHTKPTKPSMPAVAVPAGVDESLRRSILDPLMTAMHSHAEETNALVERCITDQIGIRTELGALKAEVEALKARGSAWDAADAGHSKALGDGISDMRRLTDEARAELQSSLEAAGSRHNELAGKVDKLAGELGAFRENVESAVLEALGKHVAKIEAAADKLTKTPQVRTAASIGGAFAGSAIVTAVIEIIKHM